MKLTILVHEEDGGYWAEVPALPGCATEGDTFEELLQNLYEAIDGWLAVSAERADKSDTDARELQIAV